MRSVCPAQVLAQLTFSFLFFSAVLCADSCLVSHAHGAYENRDPIGRTCTGAKRVSDNTPTDCLPAYRPDLPCLPLGEIQKMLIEHPDAPRKDLPIPDDSRIREEEQI
jgi:hypothetical protein